MNETVEETEVVNEAATTEEEATPLTTEEMKKLLKEYTNNKSIIEVPVGSGEGEKANVEVVHSVTLGDIYIMALLTILIITTLLTRLIGRR